MTGRSAHRDPQGRYADDRGHEEVGAVPGTKGCTVHERICAHRLDDVLNKFLKTMQTTATRLQDKLLKPEVRQKGKEQVKEKGAGFCSATAEPFAGRADTAKAICATRCREIRNTR